MPADPARGPTPLPAPRPGLPRIVEVPIAALGLVVLSPVLLVAAVAIAASSPGPIVFQQQRVGRGGRPFPLYKLRSMRLDAAGPSLTARVDTRVTPVGRVLRRTKLDELPQLWNVVRGDMSLVGPRPEVARYADLTDPRWQRILEVRPGITDPLTLKLRDEETLLPAAPEERERFYLETLQPMKLAGYLDYLAQRTPWTDVAVLFSTLVAIVQPQPGATHDELTRGGRL